MSWFSKDADQTYLALGGLFIACVIVVGLMWLHNAEGDLLSPEHIMALIGMPLTILSYAVGKKVGEMTANGNNKKGDES